MNNFVLNIFGAM